VFKKGGEKDDEFYEEISPGRYCPMAYGVKCPACGLTQMPRPACKACGGVLQAPAVAPSRTPSRVPPPRVPPADPPPRMVAPRTTEAMATEGMMTTAGTMGAEWTTVAAGAMGAVGATGTMRAPEPTRPMRPPEIEGIPASNRCTECGLVYRKDQLVRIGDALVCAGCKPIYIQRLREGVTPAGEYLYGGFWIRFVAKIIDGMITGIAGVILGFVGGFVGGPPGYLFTNLLSIILNVAYVTYFLGKFGATPGKMALGLKVVRPDGETVSYARAFGRFFAEILSSMILLIGYIMAGFDEEKRALHDRICDTRVIKKT